MCTSSMCKCSQSLKGVFAMPTVGAKVLLGNCCWGKGSGNGQWQLLTRLPAWTFSNSVYLFQDKSWGYRTDIWCEGRSSICLHSQGQGCHTLSWPAELLHHNFGNSLHKHPTSPTAHPPGTKEKRGLVYHSVIKNTKTEKKLNRKDLTVLSFSHLDVHGAVLFSAGSSVANLAVVAAGTVRPREVSSLADQLATGLPGAPQLGAGLHVWAGLRAGAEGKLTLAMKTVAWTRQVVWERQLPLRLVQQTVSYRNKPTAPQTVRLISLIRILYSGDYMTRGVQVFRYSFIWPVFCRLQLLISHWKQEAALIYIFGFKLCNWSCSLRSHRTKQESFGIF